MEGERRIGVGPPHPAGAALDFAYNGRGRAGMERERPSVRGTPMRHAIIVASSYHESSQLAALPTAPEAAAAIAARVGAPDSGFGVHTLSADRDLPERVDELLFSLDPAPEATLFYFRGYAAWIGNHAPALVLNAPRLRAYSLGRLCSALERRAPSTLLVLDVRLVVDPGRTPGEAAEAICDVIDEAPSVEAIVAAHQAGTSPDAGSPFTRIFLGSWEWLAAVRGSTAATSRDLFQLVQVGERLVNGLVAARFSAGNAEVPLLPPLGGTPPPPPPDSDPGLEPADSLPPPPITTARTDEGATATTAGAAPVAGMEAGAPASAAPEVVPGAAGSEAGETAMQTVTEADIVPLPADEAPVVAMDTAPTHPVTLTGAEQPAGSTTAPGEPTPLAPAPALGAPSRRVTLLDEDFEATLRAEASAFVASAPGALAALPPQVAERILRAATEEARSTGGEPSPTGGEPSPTASPPLSERPQRRLDLGAAPPPPLARVNAARSAAAALATPNDGIGANAPPTVPAAGAGDVPTSTAAPPGAPLDDEVPRDPHAWNLEPTPPPLGARTAHRDEPAAPDTEAATGDEPAAPDTAVALGDATAAPDTTDARTDDNDQAVSRDTADTADTATTDDDGDLAVAPDTADPSGENDTSAASAIAAVDEAAAATAVAPPAPPAVEEPAIVFGDDQPPAPSRWPPPPTLTLGEHLARAEQLTAESRYDEALLEVSRAIKIAGDDRDQIADLHARAASIARQRGDVNRAVAHYEEVLSRRPIDPDALFWATELLCARGEFARAARLHELRLAALTAPEERDAVLDTLAVLWIDKAHDLSRGRAVLEGLLRSRGDEPALLERLMVVLDGLGDHEESIRVRRRLAYKLADDPRRRAEVLTGAARVAHDRLQKIEFAVDLAEQALRADPAAIEALDFVAALLIERRDWPLLARCFEAVLEKLPDGVPARDLARRLGTVCRDELKDARRAVRALERAAAIDPTDPTIRFELVPLLEQSQDPARALHHCRAAIRATPRDPQAHRLARTLALRVGAHDQAWNAAHALDFLGEGDVDVSVHADTHRPEGLLAVTAPITEEEWRRGAFTPDRDAPLETLFSLVRRPAIAYRLDALARARQLPTLDPSLLLDPQTSTTMLARSFLWAVQVLCVPQPALYVHPALEVGLIAPPTREPASVVNRALGSGLDLRELSFLWGRHLTVFRPELRLLTFFPTVELLTQLTAAAALATDWTDRKASFVEPALAELARHIHEDLEDADRPALAAVTAELQRGDPAARLLEWARGVELTAARLGLVACGDVSVAAALTERFPVGGHTSVFDQVNALLAFTASDEYTALREHLGVTVHG